MAQVKGLAKAISGVAPLKNREIKEHMLKLLDKYVGN
jgi:hypothetical protein